MTSPDGRLNHCLVETMPTLTFPTTAVTWQDAKTLPGQRWMRDATSVIILPVSQTAVYGGVTEQANIMHVRTTMCGPQTSPAKTRSRRSKLRVVEHSVKTSSTNVNILDSGIWRSTRACKHRACPYNDVRTSDFTCKDAQNDVSWNIP